ncbi:MAG: hypothetical protein OMM_06879 [Candidatus Magnetoglobus multicellularis str. Araruama]|uniref:Uncharacterized protein n=1 Tax=Candidatus Magnetoglobus multicellularis str. Araruama TaxID=890399 RepID=A0A1V1PFT1_9BACT|nr:MAG: hypothetical protein OMM_06879 [Candidatus Magnetoglobus multicellularis str. Araruama]
MIDERVIASIQSVMSGDTSIPMGLATMKAGLGSKAAAAALAADSAAKAAAADTAIKVAAADTAMKAAAADTAMKAAAADTAMKAAATNAAMQNAAMTKALTAKAGAAHGGIISKTLATTSKIVMTPMFGGALALGLIIGFEFWRGKVDEKTFS